MMHQIMHSPAKIDSKSAFVYGFQHTPLETKKHYHMLYISYDLNLRFDGHVSNSPRNKIIKFLELYLLSKMHIWACKTWLFAPRTCNF
jgi:hypothetical protein